MAASGFFSLAFSSPVAGRAVKVAAIVGTLLAFINHGGEILTASVDYQGLLQIALTYLVPYCVSTWSAVRAIQASTSKYA
jgi:hypothetical protein